MRVALGHFWVNLAPHWADDAYMCGPGGAENRKCARHCSDKQIFEGPAKREHSKLRQNPAGWDPIRGHFGVTLPTLELLWEHFGYIKVILELFRYVSEKQTFPP